MILQVHLQHLLDRKVWPWDCALSSPQIEGLNVFRVYANAMKIILSRKGFDHTYGKYPSSILPNGKLVSLPVPSAEGDNNELLYDDLYYDHDEKLADLTEALGISELREKSVHLDPDLRRSTLKERDEGWRPLFGQGGASQSHLHSNKVGIGDLFLFFGWFRKTKRENGKIIFDSFNDPVGKHLIFGYLQIGQILSPGDYPEKWMEYHPHAPWIRNLSIKRNAIYVANQYLSFRPELKGGGNFLCTEKSSKLLNPYEGWYA